MSNGITKRSEEYSQRYPDGVLRTELTEYAPVRGCMVIGKPCRGRGITAQVPLTVSG
ncbi:MAG TPA: hypothetical protein PLL36_11380 [Candidatus Hydrogenedentes bacterium]|jgi:hypothetical protein|nr:MAG: hypothetical protein BWX80_03133 [Candidatus Hydrogenedentes bacterium ADurb.Bin101]HQN01673.1 hypothetical protein [Candidatus Hydrogenedentota bacterium]